MSVSADALPATPRLRGRLHQIAFICSLPMGVTLVALARTGVARTATAIYSLCLMALYGVSAAYHRIPWSPRARRWMRRLDHSMIFLLIAGSYTPLCLLVLRGPWRVSILAVVWGVAVIGIVLKMVSIDRMGGLGMALYLGLGWTAVVALPQIVKHLGAGKIALMAAGGVLYTVGAILFALNRPRLSPRVFGYHELWHSLVIGGTLCHYAMILLLALAAGAA